MEEKEGQKDWKKLEINKICEVKKMETFSLYSFWVKKWDNGKKKH